MLSEVRSSPPGALVSTDFASGPSTSKDEANHRPPDGEHLVFRGPEVHGSGPKVLRLLRGRRQLGGEGKRRARPTHFFRRREELFVLIVPLRPDLPPREVVELTTQGVEHLGFLLSIDLEGQGEPAPAGLFELVPDHDTEAIPGVPPGAVGTSRHGKQGLVRIRMA